MKPEVLLENWSHHGERLYGRFYRHTVIPDGTFAHTSRVIHFDGKAGIAETENSLYSLGAATPAIPCKWGCLSK